MSLHAWSRTLYHYFCLKETSLNYGTNLSWTICNFDPKLLWEKEKGFRGWPGCLKTWFLSIIVSLKLPLLPIFGSFNIVSPFPCNIWWWKYLHRRKKSIILINSHQFKRIVILCRCWVESKISGDLRVLKKRKNIKQEKIRFRR